MRLFGLVCLALLATSVLAGCSDAPAKQDEGAKFDDLDLKPTATTGIIRGVVVDPAILPVEGATVALTGGGQATTTKEGVFGFEGVAPGTAFLTVSKVGYKSTQQSVEVVAGELEPRIVKVLVERDPSSIPFVVQHRYTGFISCGFKAANIVFDADSCDPRGATGYAARDDSAPWFFIDQQPLYYQSEMVWEATQVFSESLVTIQWACNEGECGDDDYRLCNVRGTSPLTCRSTLEEAINSGNGVGIEEAKLGTDNQGYQVAMFANCNPQCVPDTAVGLGVAFDQAFDVYNHLFYGYMPPEDWTFVATSEVPSPP